MYGKDKPQTELSVVPDLVTIYIFLSFSLRWFIF